MFHLSEALKQPVILKGNEDTFKSVTSNKHIPN